MDAGRAKRFLLVAVGPAAAAAIGTVLFTGYVDPLWLLPQLGERPFRYCVKDQRENQINRIVHGRLGADSVLIGSSRGTFIDTARFRRERVLNMSVNGLRPVEAPELLRIYRRHQGAPRRVYVETSFFGYALTPGDRAMPERLLAMEAGARTSLYRFGRLLDWGTAAYAYETLSTCNDPRYRGITQRADGVGYLQPSTRTRAEHAQAIYDSADQMVRLLFTDGRFQPDPSLAEHLNGLFRAAGDATVVAYVPPITAENFLLKMARGLIDDYLDFLRVVVEQFGSVRHFAGINAVTTEPRNFLDSHHLRPEASEAMVAVLDGREQPHADGFGLRITRENLDAFGVALREAVCREARGRDELPDGVPWCPQAGPQRGKEIFSLGFGGNRNWSVATAATRATETAAGALIESAPGILEYQIVSDPISVEPGRAYLVELDLELRQGEPALVVLDSTERFITHDRAPRFLTRGPLGNDRNQRLFWAAAPVARIVLSHFNLREATATSFLLKSLTVSERAAR